MPPSQHARTPLISVEDADEFDVLLVPLKPAFRALGIGPTKGYELIAAGHLTRVKIGGKSLITSDSLRRFASSLTEGR